MVWVVGRPWLRFGWQQGDGDGGWAPLQLSPTVSTDGAYAQETEIFTARRTSAGHRGTAATRHFCAPSLSLVLSTPDLAAQDKPPSPAPNGNTARSGIEQPRRPSRPSESAPLTALAAFGSALLCSALLYSTLHIPQATVPVPPTLSSSTWALSRRPSAVAPLVRPLQTGTQPATRHSAQSGNCLAWKPGGRTLHAPTAAKKPRWQLHYEEDALSRPHWLSHSLPSLPLGHASAQTPPRLCPVQPSGVTLHPWHLISAS